MKQTEIGGIPINMLGVALETPEVFISSTYRDLSKIRELLHDWLEGELGYTPHIFESSKFPRSLLPDPMDATLQVIDRSNIYVLIIDTDHFGTPYSKSSGAKSITWHEWLRALSLIPFRIILVNESLISNYYHEGSLVKEGTLKEYSKDVFKFISELNSRKEWIFPYKSIEDIKSIIRNQLALSFGGLIKFLPKLKWFLSEQATRYIESSAKEVWVASPDLYWDATDHDFREFVLDNICKKGIVYKYLIPDTERIQNNVDSLVKAIDSCEKESDTRIEFYFIKKEITPFEFAIYDPNTRNEKGLFVNLMQVDNHRNKFNVEMGHDFCALYKKEFEKGIGKQIRCITSGHK